MRNHGGGFIEVDHYWDIGEEERGREGMDARQAARRYNDHRHPALRIATPAEFIDWRDARYAVSRYPDRLDVIGGTYQLDGNGNPVVQDLATPLRKAGDTALYNGVVWMWVSPGVVVPVGGQGNVDADGNFTRDVQYSSLQVVSAREVPADITDALIGNVTPLGALIGSTLLRMPRYLSMRSRVYARFTVTATLWPVKIDAQSNALRELFPCRADVLFRTLGTFDEPIAGNVPLSGFTDQIPVYVGDNLDDGEGANVAIVGGVDTLTVSETLPLALNLNKVYAVNVYGRSHAYTAAEVDVYNAIHNSAYSLEEVVEATRCTCLVNSVTFDTDSLLGVSPYVNDGGFAYTTSTRT
ncbi:MAG: hypothetical protein ACO32I_01315 [Candidatus Limnocylindrus sp.]